MGNMGIRHPGKGGKLKNIISQWTRKISFLRLFFCGCRGDISLQCISHFHRDDLEQTGIFIQICKCCVDPIKEYRITVNKAIPKFFDLARTSGNSKYE